MKRFEIKNLRTGKITHRYDDENEHPHNRAWGELERIKPEADCTPVELSESLERIEETLEDGTVLVKHHLPATYEVIITDITEEVELREWEQKIRAEYPSFQEFIEAFFEEREGRPEKMQAAMQKRAEAKEKHPKPVRGVGKG